MPAIAVAMANMKVVVPMLEWMGSMAALSLEEADWQQRRIRKLMTPTANWNEKLTSYVMVSWLSYLQHSQPHGDKAKPGVDAVQVRSACMVLPHPDSKEAQHHAWDAEQVEQDVQELSPDLAAAAAWPMHNNC